MSYEKKLERANELMKTIKDAQAELEGIFGDARRRGRPRKTDEQPQE